MQSNFTVDRPTKVGLWQLKCDGSEVEYVAITLDRYTWDLMLHGTDPYSCIPLGMCCNAWHD